MRYREIVNELVGVKKFKNMTSSQMLDYFEQNFGSTNIKVLGSGYFGAALKINGGVYKFWLIDSAYEKWMELSTQHKDNPFFPKYLSDVKNMPAFFMRAAKAPDYVRYVKMEELTPCNGAHKFELNKLGIESEHHDGFFPTIEANSIVALRNYVSSNYTEEDLMNEIIKNKNVWEDIYVPEHFNTPQIRGFVQALTILDHMMDNGGSRSFMYDLADRNFMLRGNQLVITDPIFSTKDAAICTAIKKFEEEYNSENNI